MEPCLLLYDCEDSRPSIMRTIGGCQAVAIMQPACFGGAHLSIGEFVQARGAGFAVLDAHAPLPCSKVLPCCSKVLLLMAHACMLIYIDRLCRITFRNVKVRDEKINRCDRHALISLMRIFCVRASFICSSNHQHTGLCGKYKAFYYFVLIGRAVCYEYTDDAMIW